MARKDDQSKIGDTVPGSNVDVGLLNQNNPATAPDPVLIEPPLGTDGGADTTPPDSTQPVTTPPLLVGTDPSIPASPGISDPTAPPLLGPANTTPIGTAPQREVQDNELASTQLTNLLAGDSKYIRQARQEGLELSGGLGGTSGIRASIGEAIRRGAPIAIADAQAYRDAAAQNLDSLAQFGLANIQRATSLELGVMDANTRMQTTWMNNQTQTAIARMNDITARDISNADNATRIRVTEINGAIQKSLADTQFQYNQVLNDQLHANNLEDIALQGEYNLETEARRLEAADQISYTNTYMATYTGALDRIAALNGLDIDDAAIQRATDAIWEGFYGSVELLAALYPNATPISFEGQG